MSVCSHQAAELLPEYVLEQLDPEDRRMVENHLETCAGCAREVALLRKLEDEVIARPEPWFFDSLPGKVTAQVQARRRKRRLVLVPAWAGGLVAAGMALFIFLQPFSEGPSRPDSPGYYAVQAPGSIPLGLEAEILSVLDGAIDGLDQWLSRDLRGVQPELLVSSEPVLVGDGYEAMDEETMKVFEDLIEEMTPERVRKRVMS